MQKKEKIFILAALFVAIIIAGFFYLYQKNTEQTTVVIQVDGQEYQRTSLQKNQTIIIQNGNHYNEIVIHNNQVFMKAANCPDQVCVHQGSISHSPNMIICLPNRVSIEIQSTDKGVVDAILK